MAPGLYLGRRCAGRCDGASALRPHKSGPMDPPAAGHADLLEQAQTTYGGCDEHDHTQYSARQALSRSAGGGRHPPCVSTRVSAHVYRANRAPPANCPTRTDRLVRPPASDAVDAPCNRSCRRAQARVARRVRRRASRIRASLIAPPLRLARRRHGAPSELRHVRACAALFPVASGWTPLTLASAGGDGAIVPTRFSEDEGSFIFLSCFSQARDRC